MSNHFASSFSKKFEKYSHIFQGKRDGIPPPLHFLMKKSRLYPADPAFLRFYIHQYDLRADLFDAVPGDHIIVPSAPQPKETAGTGDDDGADLPLGHLYHHIGNKAQPSAVADTDDFLALQLHKAQ